MNATVDPTPNRTRPRDHRMLRSLVGELCREALSDPVAKPWSLQGFGMLRLYLTPEIRLHVWDPGHARPEVSTMHDHPWDFESVVVCGAIENHRFAEPARPDRAPAPGALSAYRYARIQCGPGGTPECSVGPGEPIALLPQAPELWRSGDSYWQHASEIHVSRPEPGTVTICERSVPAGRSRDHARVFWPEGGRWVSAEPRPATRDEVRTIVGLALARLEAGL